jgi:aryl-alcohol dehydrogenase-like predicted oxidoreductase
MISEHVLGTGPAALHVSGLGLGCMGMTYAYGAADEAESLRTLNRALELGINFWDSSDSYGPYTNEELLARAIPGDRSSVIIASKFGQEFRADGTRGINGRPEYIRTALEGSLRRLGTDYIDLYYQHRVDRDIPVEETWGTLSELVSEGKVRYLGLSEASADTIRRAHATHPITALQTEWSLWTRDVEENGILDTTRELGIGFVPYSPLGRGFLTGAISSPEDLAEDDGRRSWPRFQPDALAANKAIADAVTSVAERVGASPAQVAIAWLLAKGTDIVPIPGARKVHHLEDNAKAMQVHLSDSVLAELDAAAPFGAVVGERYPAALMKTLDG